ncbi:TlpA family protein disulfide reductase [Xanthomarina sp. GH4-25]|uniref:TlpA family protein disulfide reductase n=1 Tax=Xanthomarina sp. GH4-25 TaxID=3349335 RepID=UPI003877CCFB
MKYFYLILLFALTLISCKKDSKTDEGDVAFIGGELINPTVNYVIISKGKEVLDTVTLNKKNRFNYKISHMEPGLYKFHHGVEYQMILLEPNDSLMLRLNTMEFDESLVFTGKGARKNNYLINLFLNSEVEEKAILGFSQLPAKDFESKLDSIRDSKLRKLKRFSGKLTLSDLFIELVEANINYDYYLSKEVYPFVNYTNTEREILEGLPEGFYDFREKLNYNDDNLKDYFPYYSFLKHHFENVALAEHFKHSTDSVFDKKSLEFSLIKLNLIDSLLTDESIKNSLLIGTAIEFISNNKDVDSYDAMLISYTSKSTNSGQKNYVEKIVKALKGLKAGNPLPDIKVFDVNDNELNLRRVTNKKPSVVFFWSQANLMHLKECHNKVKELKTKYPEISFIGVNANNENKELWLKTLEKYGLSAEKEYLFKFPKEANQALAIYPINKVIIINKKGLIENAHTNMFSINFEEELLGVLNQ